MVLFHCMGLTLLAFVISINRLQRFYVIFWYRPGLPGTSMEVIAKIKPATRYYPRLIPKRKAKKVSRSESSQYHSVEKGHKWAASIHLRQVYRCMTHEYVNIAQKCCLHREFPTDHYTN